MPQSYPKLDFKILGSWHHVSPQTCNFHRCRPCVRTGFNARAHTQRAKTHIFLYTVRAMFGCVHRHLRRRLPLSTDATRWTRTRRVSRTPRSLSVDVCTAQSILIAGCCGCPPSISVQTVINYRFCMCYCRLSEPYRKSFNCIYVT